MAEKLDWKNETLILLRGPSLIIICSLFLILPILLQVTPQTLIAISGLLLGCLITLNDVSHPIRRGLQSIQEMAHSAAMKVVLDEILFAFVSMCGGMCGGVAVLGSMYSTPFLTAEHRVKFIQSMLPSGGDARSILLSPGGLWSVIPKDWVQRFSIGGGGDSDGDSGGGKRGYDARTDDTPPPLERESHGETLMLRDDMTWDDCTEDNTTADPDMIEQVVINDACCDPPTVTIDESISTEIDTNVQDPVECCLQIGREILSDMGTSVFNEFNERYLRTIGLSSVLGLMIQMRFSGAARKSASHIIQGSLTLTLATLAVGTLSTIELKRCMMGANTKGGDETNRKLVVPPRGSAIHTLKNAFQLLQAQMRMDARFRRRWQGLLAVIVLYYFRSQRQHGRIMKR
eukprot:CAMPEP_0198248992 /NCGR_PEP_ID=MMETSP1447-20131203/633_1 /TAXON_ID=420782 /ORGANISM="Chaetoceros dichaeta, Strain CCMP1751" /LENGTH=401 /DNA_ID=CAMNT_0043933515 /DNA_START=29 /DNA_END=1237 /DNA_ORIENTATION=-